MPIDPHSYFDPSQGTTRSVDLRLRVDFESHRLEGSAVLHFGAPLAGGPLDLDTRGLEIQACLDAKGQALRWKLGEPDAILGARLRIEGAHGESIEIRYRTSPNASALQWLAPAQTAGKQQPYLFTQCQAIHARSLCPLQDSPGARIRYRASIDAPAGLQALMSARAEGKAEAAGGRATWRFEMPEPIPPYLLALAVGELHSRELSPRSRVWAEPAVVEKAAWEFAEVEKMIAAAEGLFGPYDWERFDLLVMPPSFPYGGMENPRITFLTPTLIAGDRSLVDVVAHELAHSWTGNLVSNASANDFWLNEGFTVYAERRILEALYGPEHAALKSAQGRLDLEAELQRLAGSPHTRLRNQLQGVDPDEVFSVVPYEKGYLFLTLLERAAGRAELDRFLKGYLKRFRFQSITTADFEAALEQALPGLAAKVGARRWIDEPGLPADAPRFQAPRLDALLALAKGWAASQRPDPAEARRWSASEWQLYLHALPETQSTADCEWLDSTFNLTQQGNMEVLVAWLKIAAASGYAPARPRIREVLSTVGRMKYLKPLYRALAGRPDSLPFARELFREVEAGYHGIAAAGIRAILDAAGR